MDSLFYNTKWTYEKNFEKGPVGISKLKRPIFKKFEFEMVKSEMPKTVIPVSAIPDWIKKNAGWWADGSIDDDSFIQGIQFLIKEGLIHP